MSVQWPPDLSFERAVGATAATGVLQSILGRSRYPGTVSTVTYIPSGSVTGAATNNRTLTLFNRSTGGGTVSVASLQLVSGTNLVDNTPTTITLSTVAGARDVNPGDILEWDSSAVSSGLTDSGGLVIVQMAYRT